MIKITHKGNFKHTKSLFKNLKKRDFYKAMDSYGRLGVDALMKHTPVDTGLTASSWRYELVEEKNKFTILWHNDNVVNYVNIAVIIQYGHATGNGGYVEGRDYINPAIQPIFDRIANSVWKEVIRS